jgi:hypothetical protein
LRKLLFQALLVIFHWLFLSNLFPFRTTKPSSFQLLNQVERISLLCSSFALQTIIQVWLPLSFPENKSLGIVITASRECFFIILSRSSLYLVPMAVDKGTIAIPIPPFFIKLRECSINSISALPLLSFFFFCE